MQRSTTALSAGPRPPSSAGGVRSRNRHAAEIPLARAALELWRRLPELVGDDGGACVSGRDGQLLHVRILAQRQQQGMFTGSGTDHKDAHGCQH